MSGTVIASLAISILTIVINVYRFGYSRGDRDARRELRAHPAHPHRADIAAARRRRAAKEPA